MTGTVVANSILNRAFKEKIAITPMKLQKILYFVYLEYLKLTDDVPFTEQFEVWKYGPVLPSVYAEFASYRGNHIISFAEDSQGTVFVVNEKSSPEMRAALDTAWEKYKDYAAVDLARITHEPGRAWRIAREACKAVITKDDVLKEIENV